MRNLLEGQWRSLREQPSTFILDYESPIGGEFRHFCLNESFQMGLFYTCATVSKFFTRTFFRPMPLNAVTTCIAHVPNHFSHISTGCHAKFDGAVHQPHLVFSIYLQNFGQIWGGVDRGKVWWASSITCNNSRGETACYPPILHVCPHIVATIVTMFEHVGVHIRSYIVGWGILQQTA